MISSWVVTCMGWTCEGVLSGCVLHVVTPLSSTAPVWLPPWRSKKRHSQGVWVHVSVQWGAYVTYRPYVEEVTCCMSGCHGISCCHLEWKSSGELYNVNCQLPMVAGTHEPTFKSTKLKLLGLLACLLHCELTISTAVLSVHYNTVFGTQHDSWVPRVSVLSVHCLFFGNNMTYWLFLLFFHFSPHSGTSCRSSSRR